MPTIGAASGNVGNQPLGGSAGQVIVKNTAADFDASWANLSQVAQGSYYVSGYWYDQRQRYGAGSTAPTQNANAVSYVPVNIVSAITVTDMAFWISDATVTTYSLGISTCSPTTGRPGTLIRSASGTTSGAAGAQVLTFGTPASLSPGWHYLALGNVASFGCVGVPLVTAIALPSGVSAPTAVGATCAYRDLFSSGVPVSDPANVTAVAQNNPCIFYRVQ